MKRKEGKIRSTHLQASPRVWEIHVEAGLWVGRGEDAMTKEIEVGDKFISRRGNNIAVIVYLSVNNDVGYRLKWTKRIRHATSKNFHRNYIPLREYENQHRDSPLTA